MDILHVVAKYGLLLLLGLAVLVTGAWMLRYEVYFEDGLWRFDRWTGAVEQYAYACKAWMPAGNKSWQKAGADCEEVDPERSAAAPAPMPAGEPMATPLSDKERKELDSLLGKERLRR